MELYHTLMNSMECLFVCLTLILTFNLSNARRMLLYVVSPPRPKRHDIYPIKKLGSACIFYRRHDRSNGDDNLN